MAIRDRVRQIKHLQNKNFVCVLEAPKNAANIASAMRNVSAFGVEKLYVIGDQEVVRDFETARTNRRLASASVGASKWVFVRQFASTADCVAHLRSNGFTIAVTSPHAQDKANVNLYEGTFTQKKLAVVFGNEAAGISDEALTGADMCIQVPMGGIVESLNLGTSTGIILSYISYQRLRFVFDRGRAKDLAGARTFEEFLQER